MTSFKYLCGNLNLSGQQNDRKPGFIHQILKLILIIAPSSGQNESAMCEGKCH